MHPYPSYLFLWSDSEATLYCTAWQDKNDWCLSWDSIFDGDLYTKILMNTKWQLAKLEFDNENKTIKSWFKLKNGTCHNRDVILWCIQLQLRFYWEGVLYLKVKQVSSWSLRSRFRMKRDFGGWVPPKVFIEVQQWHKDKCATISRGMKTAFFEDKNYSS